ncbi:TatD family hydrolase [Halorhodospira halochloris]|uniref:TatD family hydrolase n=1 Tax=Halorhodospira halochloris TaxID=1052 RepID=UPI001EE95D91|nr:TatD family hydrolase [Halorhodospira halochloris]MCG5547953.1 TatD family hydrolase [Halorhodospira halochloris]
MEWIDIGANLTHHTFKKDLHGVLERAHEASVVQMFITGTDERESIKAQALASQHPGTLYSTAGFHPHMASQFSSESESVLRELAAQPEVVAIGETGLDFYRNHSPPEVQQRVFERHLELAAELKLPVFLHQRDAHKRFVEIVRAYRDELVDGVAHCFTEGPEEARDYLELGLHIGVTGWICDERRGQSLRRAVAEIPRQSLMVETDCPYLLPRDVDPQQAGLPVKNRRNEPSLLPHIGRAVAHYSGRDVEELALTSAQVARRFFRVD